MQSIEKAKSLFFSSVSHELRTPLQLISGVWLPSLPFSRAGVNQFASVSPGPLTDLEASETDPRRKTSFNLALRNTSRLIRLVDSL